MFPSVNTLLFFSLLICLSACTNSSTPSKPQHDAAPPVISGNGEMPDVTYVNPSVDRTEAGKAPGSPFSPELLQSIFPLDAAGLNRFSGSNGIPTLLENQTGTQSRIVYKHPTSGQQLSLTIIDSGVLGLTMDQIVSWIKSPRNVETGNTIDRTGAMKGFPYYEHYLKDAQEGELRLLVNKRFEVVVSAQGIPYEEMKKVLMEWDLTSLY
jgi:hypothetical protein